MTEGLDLLAGADAIAAFMGIKPRRVYHLAETQRLPVFRLGATLCARRSTLVRWIEEMERETLQCQITGHGRTSS